MESTIFVRVIAKAIVFPGDIEIQYQCLDDCGIYTGKSYRGLHLSWAEVQRHFGSIRNLQKSARGTFAKEKRPSSVIAK